MRRYHKYLINNFKFGKFLPGLKTTLSNIYSKNVELNIVNLKYPHLNSDIYTDLIASKLRKKMGLLKVLRKSLKLVKTPYEFYAKNKQYDLNLFKSLTIHKTLNVNYLEQNLLQSNPQAKNESNGKDVLNILFGSLFPYTLVQGFTQNYFSFSGQKDSFKNNLQLTMDKVTTVLNTLKYK